MPGHCCVNLYHLKQAIAMADTKSSVTFLPSPPRPWPYWDKNPRRRAKKALATPCPLDPAPQAKGAGLDLAQQLF